MRIRCQKGAATKMHKFLVGKVFLIFIYEEKSADKTTYLLDVKFDSYLNKNLDVFTISKE